MNNFWRIGAVRKVRVNRFALIEMVPFVKLVGNENPWIASFEKGTAKEAMRL
jgi:hypothetical protein